MRAAIVGGGISGLTLAYRLSQSREAREGKLEIHVFEATPGLGGVLQTEIRNECLMERGPDAFISAKPWAVELCRELGLDGELMQTNADVRQSFILSRNKLVPVPRGFYLMSPTKISDVMRTPLLSLKGKIRMAGELFIPRRRDEGDESLASFVRRRFGCETLERIAQPMIAGIYSADPEELSLEATFPDFLKMERECGSVIRGLAKKKDMAVSKASGPRYSLFLTLKGGMHALIVKLREQMPQVHFHYGSKATKLRRGRGTCWELFFESERPFEADVACLALPASAASRLIEPLHRDLAETLGSIQYETVATVNLIFNRKSIRHPLDGFGYVVPTIENKRIIGCTFSSIKFPGRSADDEKVLLRAFVGGKASREFLKLPDDAVVSAVSGEVSLQLGISAAPLSTMLSRWPESIPQYRVGHLQTVEKVFNGLKKFQRLYVTGNAYGGTGVPDCIKHASETAVKIYDELKLLRGEFAQELV